jgi:uroporphyrinogen-III synthase
LPRRFGSSDRTADGSDDMSKLTGLRILVPETRELDLFASMLEAEGAAVQRCPLVQILDLEDPSEAIAWIDDFIAGGFDELVLLTGEGLRRLLAICDTRGSRAEFLGALTRVRTLTRGPKPARVLKELGLSPSRAAPEPTSQSVLELLAGDELDGRRLGVQLYPGDGALPLIAGLRDRGADVRQVTPYRYASRTETNRVADAIRSMIDGRTDMVAFTSSPQIERLLAVAEDAGLIAELRRAFDRVDLARVDIAAVGPVVEATLRKHALPISIRPTGSFHLKPLVRAIVAAWISDAS